MSVQWLCHCGFPENNHHFKHEFEGKIKVEKKECFVIDANRFPIEHKIICSFPQCKLSQKIHDSLYTPEELEIINQNGKITHEFQPQTIKERKLSFMVPLEAKCLSCNKTLETHDKVPSGIKMLDSDLHSFSAPVLFLNRKPYDIVILQHPKNLNYKFSPLNEIKPEGNDQQK